MDLPSVEPVTGLRLVAPAGCRGAELRQSCFHPGQRRLCEGHLRSVTHRVCRTGVVRHADKAAVLASGGSRRY